jgi:prepilin-type N-terminal cleavage/methylation domain-containing protein
MRSYRRRGFTLIEILIVVVILGILATVVIGVFANASGDASAKAL